VGQGFELKDFGCVGPEGELVHLLCCRIFGQRHEAVVCFDQIDDLVPSEEEEEIAITHVIIIIIIAMVRVAE